MGWTWSGCTDDAAGVGWTWSHCRDAAPGVGCSWVPNSRLVGEHLTEAATARPEPLSGGGSDDSSWGAWKGELGRKTQHDLESMLSSSVNYYTGIGRRLWIGARFTGWALPGVMCRVL